MFYVLCPHPDVSNVSHDENFCGTIERSTRTRKAFLKPRRGTLERTWMIRWVSQTKQKRSSIDIEEADRIEAGFKRRQRLRNGQGNQAKREWSNSHDGQYDHELDIENTANSCDVKH